MIKYTLNCKNGHEFDSWFSDSESFEKLKKKGHLECAICSSKEVEKSLMAPRITSDSQERTNLTGFRMMGAQTGTNLMALFAFPIVFWIGGDDESLGFIVLAIIAGFAAMCIHAITFLTVK